MPLKKNQHYVPQFYLRHFSPDERSIGMHHIASGRSHTTVSVKDQCSKDWLYGKGGTEEALGGAEGVMAQILRELITYGPPDPHSIPHSNILEILILQRGRTIGAGEDVNEVLRRLGEYLIPAISVGKVPLEEAKKFELTLTDPVGQALDHSLYMWPLILDLGMVMLENRTREGFVTSDDPVVLYNKFLETKEYGIIGYQSIGLQIFYPLSPTHALLLYDQGVYSLKPAGRVIQIKSSSDIFELNRLATLNSRSCFYFNPKANSVEHISRIAKDIATRRGGPKSTSKKFIKVPSLSPRRGTYYVAANDNERGRESGPKEELLMVSRRTPNLRLALSFCSVLPGMATNRGNYMSGPTTRDPKLHRNFKRFRELVERGRYDSSQFIQYLLDLYLHDRIERTRREFPYR